MAAIGRREPSGAAESAPKRNLPPDWAPKFLEIFRSTGNVRLSAQAAGIDRDAVYRRRQRDPAFGAAWAAAREDAVDALEGEARRRALQQSDTLLIFLLKSLRPEVYRDHVRVDLRQQAEALASTLGDVTADELVAEADRIVRGLK